MIDLDGYIEQAETALMKLLHEWRPRLMESHGVAKFDLKADSSVVTELDKGLELAIKDVLRPLSSEVGFIGEEHGQEGPSDMYWFVDPIDGTEQYIRGLDGCRTLLTLIVLDEPAYAFAYRFPSEDLFTAQKGKGAKKNGQQIKLIARPLNRVWVEFAVNMQLPENVQAMALIGAAVHSVVYTKEFLNVLEGSIDAYIVLGGKGKVWDYAPRALLMSESGLKVTNIGSDTYNYKNLDLIAAQPAIFNALHNLLSPQA
jgi:myo-inositol-1(or 4)-monophosphatase